MLKYPQLIAFIRAYGDQAYLGDNEKLDDEIDWFLSYRRIFIIKSKGRLMALCAFLIVDSPPLVLTEWPTDNPLGKYVWIPYIVIHPKIRHMRVMDEMVKESMKWFPNMRYIVYFRENKKTKKVKRKIIFIEKFLTAKKEVSYV